MISFGVGTLGCQFPLRWKAKPIVVFRQQTSFSGDTAHKTRAYPWPLALMVAEEFQKDSQEVTTYSFLLYERKPLKEGSDHQMLSDALIKT